MLGQVTNVVAGGAGGLPDPGSFGSVGWVVVVLAGLVLILRNVIGLWRDMNRPEREKREVTISASLPSKEELDRLFGENKREHENLFSKIGGVDRGAAQKIDERIEKLREERRGDMRQLHEEVGHVGMKVSALEATNQAQSQRLAAIDAKLDRLIERKL